MPAVTGLDFLRRVKGAPALRRIPLVVLTVSVDDADRAECYDRGANSYLVKPVAYPGFLDLMRGVEGYWLELNVHPPARDRA